jgi:hypothetical protein
MGMSGGKKIDAVVVGVRYQPDGSIDWVRAYERRGPTWSDWKLITRDELVQRLKAGQIMVAGERQTYQASTFKTGEELRLSGSGDREVVVSGAGDSVDHLSGVPAV